MKVIFPKLSHWPHSVTDVTDVKLITMTER